MDAEELQDVTLVGHSYAGVIVTSVAERAFARLARLVYPRGAYHMPAPRTIPP